MPCPISTLTDKALTMPRSARLVFLASVAALAFVFIMQYGFGLQPCILCKWQRLPYALTALLSGISLLMSQQRRQAVIAILVLCILCFLGGMALAIFHTGVELHWWLGTSSCSVQPLSGSSPEDLREALLHTVTARCDEIAWTFLGLSMANYNVVASLLLATFTTVAAAKSVQK